MSQHKAVTEADVQDIVEEAGFEVRSVHFDTSAGSGRMAYIRLEPPGAAKAASAEPEQPEQKPALVGSQSAALFEPAAQGCLQAQQLVKPRLP